MNSLFSNNFTSFIPKDDCARFDTFYERKIEGIGTVFRDDVEVETLKNWSINVDNSKKNNFNSFLESQINGFKRFGSKSDGLIIHCRKGDGVSWVSEKIFKMTETILSEYGYNTKVDIIKKTKYPLSNYIKKRMLVKLAIKEGLIKDISSNLTLSIIMAIVAIPLILIDKIASILSVFKGIELNEWKVYIFIVAIIFFCYSIWNLLKKIIKDRQQEECSFLEKIESIEINEIKYYGFISKISNRIRKPNEKKIIIIDDIATIDKQGLSQEILLSILNNNLGNGKIYWIVLSTDLTITKRITNKEDSDFQELTLELLTAAEKKEFCTNLGYPQNNLSNATIKEICIGEVDKETQDSLTKELLNLKEDNLKLFHFIYLLILNNYPIDSEYSKKLLTEKIPARRVHREKDVYIKQFFDTIPTVGEIENYFEDERVIKHYGYKKENESFGINSDICRLIEDSPNLFEYFENYRYGHSYWALTWYYANRSKSMPKVHVLRKISYHLQKADNGINDVNARKSLLEAHLFATRCSLIYIQRQDIINSLNHLLRLNIQGIEDVRRNDTVKHILEAFYNFEYLPNNRPRIEDLDSEKLVQFLKSRETTLAYSLLKNQNYSMFSGYIVSLLIEQYWERTFFIWVFSKSVLSYGIMPDVLEDLKKQRQSIISYIDNDDKDSSLFLSNLAIFIWTNYIDFLIGNYSTDINQLSIHIELFLSSYNKNRDNNRNDIYQQTTIEESVCIVAAVVLLILNKHEIGDTNKFEEFLNQSNTIFTAVEIDNTEKSIDKIIHYLFLHSLMWKNNDFIIKYSILSIIRIQLFSFTINEKDITSNKIEIEVKSKELLKTIDLDSKTRLSTLLSFSLSENSYLIKDEHRSSFLFQQSLQSIGNSKISNIEFEYLFYCINVCWYHSSSNMKEIIRALIISSEEYFQHLVKKILENPDSYLHICNSLIVFERNELFLNIEGTHYNVVSFFTKLIEKASAIKEANLEEANCIWTNFKFQNLTLQEKKLQKLEYERFWVDRTDSIYFTNALRQLYSLESTNVSKETETKAFHFIQNNIYSNYSAVILLACSFCDDKKNKGETDDKYFDVLNKVCEIEEPWEKLFGNIYSNSIELYETLFKHTGDESYNKKYKYYKLQETKEKIENFEIKDYMNFLFSIYEIFKNDININDDISQEEGLQISNKNIKDFLENISVSTIIYNNEVSLKFLLICQYSNTEFNNRALLFEKYNVLAKKSINELIQLIMNTPSNRKYMERIKELYDELNNPSRLIEIDDD